MNVRLSMAVFATAPDAGVEWMCASLSPNVGCSRKFGKQGADYGNGEGTAPPSNGSLRASPRSQCPATLHRAQSFREESTQRTGSYEQLRWECGRERRQRTGTD